MSTLKLHISWKWRAKNKDRGNVLKTLVLLVKTRRVQEYAIKNVGFHLILCVTFFFVEYKFREIFYPRVFGIAEYESDVKNTKFKMANPIWRIKLSKLIGFTRNIAIWRFTSSLIMNSMSKIQYSKCGSNIWWYWTTSKNCCRATICKRIQAISKILFVM